MKKTTLAVALCLLISSPTLCKANSSPWCVPDVVTLTFKNQQDRDLARIELRSLKKVCDGNPEKNGFGLRLERSLRIEHGGRWTEVPKECLSGISFGVDGLSLSGDDTGLGIYVAGKQTDNDENMKIGIFKLSDGQIMCSQVEPCTYFDDDTHQFKQCSTKLR